MGEEDCYNKEEGLRAAEAMTDEPCVWDQDINYELQVELLLTLRRLLEQFMAAALSIHHSRSFDAVYHCARRSRSDQRRATPTSCSGPTL